MDQMQSSSGFPRPEDRKEAAKTISRYVAQLRAPAGGDVRHGRGVLPGFLADAAAHHDAETPPMRLLLGVDRSSASRSSATLPPQGSSAVLCGVGGGTAMDRG